MHRNNNNSNNNHGIVLLADSARSRAKHSFLWPSPESPNQSLDPSIISRIDTSFLRCLKALHGVHSLSLQQELNPVRSVHVYSCLTIHQAKYFPFILIMSQFQRWLDSCLLLVLYQYLYTGFALPNKAFIWGWVFSDLWLRVQGRWGHFKLVKYRTQHNLLMALVSGENCN